MSHVTEFTDVTITNLNALTRAIEVFCPDLEMVKGQSYRTYKTDHGKLVGDWDLPAGVSAEEVGENAEFVIRFTDEALRRLFPGRQRNEYGAPYEIGVVPRRDGQGYLLCCDFWLQGLGLLSQSNVGQYANGKAMGNLYAYYRMAEDAIAAAANGDVISFQEVGDHWEATIDTTARLGY